MQPFTPGLRENNSSFYVVDTNLVGRQNPFVYDRTRFGFCTKSIMRLDHCKSVLELFTSVASFQCNVRSETLQQLNVLFL
jgi:hypothetical protein